MQMMMDGLRMMKMMAEMTAGGYNDRWQA